MAPFLFSLWMIFHWLEDPLHVGWAALDKDVLLSYERVRLCSTGAENRVGATADARAVVGTDFLGSADGRRNHDHFCLGTALAPGCESALDFSRLFLLWNCLLAQNTVSDREKPRVSKLSVNLSEVCTRTGILLCVADDLLLTYDGDTNNSFWYPWWIPWKHLDMCQLHNGSMRSNLESTSKPPRYCGGQTQQPQNKVLWRCIISLPLNFVLLPFNKQNPLNMLHFTDII